MNQSLRKHRADAMRMCGLLFDAEREYRTILAETPNDVDTMVNLAGVLQLIGKGFEAIPFYERALRYAGFSKAGSQSFDLVLGELIRAYRQEAKWEHLMTLEEQALERMDQGNSRIEPLIATVICDNADHLKKNAANYWPNHTYQGVPTTQRRAGPLRIGYISGDFREHPTAHLMAEVVAAHDKEKFQIFGYSLQNPDGSEVGNRIASACSKFLNLKPYSNEAIAAVIRQDDIDILVDLMGFNLNSRLGIHQYRPAKHAVQFLAFPGTYGTKLVDFVIADHIVVPPGSDIHYSEQVIRLDGCYQPSGALFDVQGGGQSRREAGLPEDAFVFCNLGQFYKIGPQVFQLYMNILAAEDSAVLWLLEDRFDVRARIRNEALKRGIDPDRLHFSARVPRMPHLQRHLLADCFLDSYPYGAHTSASDAIRMGLPVLTLSGNSFASRVSRSILETVGATELIALSPNEFVEKAIQLCRSKQSLSIVKSKLVSRQNLNKIFDPTAYCRKLEDAYLKIARSEETLSH